MWLTENVGPKKNKIIIESILKSSKLPVSNAMTCYVIKDNKFNLFTDATYEINEKNKIDEKEEKLVKTTIEKIIKKITKMTVDIVKKMDDVIETRKSVRKPSKSKT